MIVLDTCAFIWDALDHPKLTARARKSIDIAEDSGELAVCDISLWETAMLIKKGRVVIDATAERFCELAIRARDIRVLPITPSIAELSVQLDASINFDPADRLIAASTIFHNASLITADNNLIKSPAVETLW